VIHLVGRRAPPFGLPRGARVNRGSPRAKRTMRAGAKGTAALLDPPLADRMPAHIVPSSRVPQDAGQDRVEGPGPGLP